MVRRLKAEGYYVRGLSRHQPRYWKSEADDYWTCDLRDTHVSMFDGFSSVYNLGCHVGGLGFIINRPHHADILRDSTLIDINVLDACKTAKVPKVFFASSACVYNSNKRFFTEGNAYPADPINEFAWQKLFAERLYSSYAENHGIDVKIGRIFNTYGVGMTWEGGREKSVAALCCKVAEAKQGGVVHVWGSGQQTRSFTHVDDCVEGIWRLMQSECKLPMNIGPQQEVSIMELAVTIAKTAGKDVFFIYEGSKPTGVPKICSDNTAIRKALGWEPTITIEEGLKMVYPWVAQRVLDGNGKAA